MNRLKNYGMWIAIVALIPLMVDALSTYEIFILLPANYEKLCLAILGILVLAGIINDPSTENHGFADDK